MVSPKKKTSAIRRFFMGDTVHGGIFCKQFGNFITNRPFWQTKKWRFIFFLGNFIACWHFTDQRLPWECNCLIAYYLFEKKWWLSSSLFSPKFICFASINTYSCGRENILNLLIRNFSERKLYKNVILCRNVYYEYNLKKGQVTFWNFVWW